MTVEKFLKNIEFNNAIIITNLSEASSMYREEVTEDYTPEDLDKIIDVLLVIDREGHIIFESEEDLCEYINSVDDFIIEL